jgi:hypothetical protein
MKKEIIPFNDFMKGNYETKKPINLKNYSIVPMIPKMMFFNKPVLILVGVGATFLLISEIERQMIKKGHEVSAELFSTVISILIPVIGFGAICVLITKAFNVFL